VTGDGGTPPESGEPSTAVEILGGSDSSLLDAVDSLLNRGAMLTGDLVLGLADVDLVYLRLSTLVAAADRVFGGPEKPENPAGTRPPEDGAPPGDGAATPREREPDRPPSGAPHAAPVREPAADRASADPQDPSPTETARPVAEGPGDAETLRRELERTLGAHDPGRSGEPDEPAATPGSEPRATGSARWNADPEDVERSLARLVLALVEFLRKLMERQAIRRMEEGTLSEDEVERLGRALMRLEQTVHDMAARFGLAPEELNLDLGPLGRLT